MDPYWLLTGEYKDTSVEEKTDERENDKKDGGERNGDVSVEGDGNQLNWEGAHGNINCPSDPIMAERVRSLETLVAEKDERIADLKERISELKSQRK